MDSSLPPDEGLYSIREVAGLLGLRPATLRAWERRFGLPRPKRAANGYRRYSQTDLELLRQLKARTDGGLRIGSAILSLPASSSTPSHELEFLRSSLGESILRLNERRTTLTLREAFTLHPVETVLTEVVEPMLVWIGDEWQAGHVSVGVEHFASALFMRQLVALYLAAPEPWRPGRILAASVPGDLHEIGLLVLTVALRRRGWDVLYFGADLPLDELGRAAASLQPTAVLLSTTLTLNKVALSALDDLPIHLGSPDAAVLLGGRGARDLQPVLRRTIVLDGGLARAVPAIETILLRREDERLIS
jgi:DNA-binding transcriptional MerR regulator/methylmalonyl-CoA mutase cobalamin-binding subunit